MQRSFTVFRSPPSGEFAKRFSALAHVPCILDSRPGYDLLANDYIIDRALAIWPQDDVKKRLPSARTLDSYANWLANFLEWASVRSVDLSLCTYSGNIVPGYQGDMLNGTWSRDGLPLNPATVNARVQQACDYLCWMAARGHRKAFDVPYKQGFVRYASSTNPSGQVTRPVRVRVGKLRNSLPQLDMPPVQDVRAWLDATYKAVGSTRGLMCETILLTGMRREEVVSLRFETLPQDPQNWLVVNPLAPTALQQVRITITAGTKGPTYGEDHGDKLGPSRSILIPLSLAQRWHAYRNVARGAAFKQWLNGVEGVRERKVRAQQAVHLFLDERNGRRFTGKRLYDAWRAVPIPFGGWSPHKGRHWWACSVLQRELKRHERLFSSTPNDYAQIMQSTALNIIRLHIQPQLGHESDTTSVRYLRWALEQIVMPMYLEDED